MLLFIISTKLYLCPKAGKKTEFIIRLIKYLNVYKGQIYFKPLYNIQIKYYNKEENLGRNLKYSENDLSDIIDNIVAANIITEMLIKNTLQKRLFPSEFLSILREKWSISYEFSAGIPILNKIFRYPRSKYKNSFFFFNDQLDYNLTHYFTE